MYHYQKNIGDYRSATMHLSLLEHGVYNQLLDWYYLDEQPISIDNRTLFRRLSAKTEAEQEAVLNVLEEMFSRTDAGWVHKRVEREITQYKAKSAQAREAGKLGGRPSKKGIGYKNNRDGLEKEPDAKPTANQEPRTNNQEPNTPLPPGGGIKLPGFESFWKAWPTTDRKQAKGKCLDAWKKASAERDAAVVLAHVEYLKNSSEWQRENGQFIPAPLPYLNQRRWEGAATESPLEVAFV